MRSLKLFNAVVADTPPYFEQQIIDTLPMGFIIAPEAAHLADEIIAFYRKEQLDGRAINQTFHKSWSTIQSATRKELLAHQLTHYFSTYGLQSMGMGNAHTVYLPDEIQSIPELRKRPIKVITGLTAEAIAERVMQTLRTGVALTQETIEDLLDLLVEIGQAPSSTAGIRNREALVLLADRFMAYPEQPAEFLRYLVYKATGKSLLIKSDAMIEAVKKGAYDISPLLDIYGIERCAEVFLRFKPLWLAFKSHPANTATVNRLAKLAKRYHRPLPIDYLNGVTALDEIDVDRLATALKKANAFRKIRLLYALNTRINGAEDYLFRIRNGKAYVARAVETAEVPKGALAKITGKTKRATKRNRAKASAYEARRVVWKQAYEIVLSSLLDGMDVAGKTFLVSPGIDYALPATEKMFIGNLPVGTRIRSDQPLAVGIHWRNEWGASDLDLSALAFSKVGWNADYNQGGITYSGDITDATEGATELLRFSKSCREPQLVYANVYCGEGESAFKLIAGVTPKVTANYTLKPDELLLEVKTSTKSRQQILGFLTPHGRKEQAFILVNTGLGKRAIAGAGEITQRARRALYAQWNSAPMLYDVLTMAGAFVTTDSNDAFDVDLRYESLAKDSILNLF